MRKSVLGGFMPRVSADVHQLAQNMRQQLLTREDMPKLRSIYWNQVALPGEDDPPTVFDKLSALLQELPDEGFKLFPWVVREVKKGTQPGANGVPQEGINRANFRHAKDIITNAIQWMVWAKEHNQPSPDYMNKQFGLGQLQEWVYEMNARDVDTSGGIQWKESTPVYKFPDGWHIDEVGPDDLAQEGELMGHCVGGYCDTVRHGDSTIFSLRDPKGAPHVTVEFAGDRADDVTHGYGEVTHHDRKMLIIQEQGKQDSKPIPEYQQRFDQWYEQLRDQGWDVEYSDDQEPEMREYHGDTDIYEPTHEGVQQFYHDLMHDPWKLERDEDPEVDYERGRTIYNERVPNYIGHPTATYEHQDDGEHYPARADIEHLQPAVAQTLQYLWSNPNSDEGQHLAQAYYAAAQHLTDQSYQPSKELDALAQFASNWVAQKRSKQTTPKQPTLFEPNEYFEARQMPRSVQTFMHYLVGYTHAAEEKPTEAQTWRGNNYPTMPGSGAWPLSSFPDYFGSLELSQPQWFNQDWLNQTTNPAVEAHLIAKLRRMAGYTPDWTYMPEADFEKIANDDMDWGARLDEWTPKHPGGSPYPFIFHPQTGSLTWGAQNGMHDDIIDDLVRRGERVPNDANFGRWYPENDDVDIYDPSFRELPWQEQAKHMETVRRNAPGRPQEPSGGDAWSNLDLGDQDDWKVAKTAGQNRTAMADRTGNPQIDSLIEQFLQQPQGDWTTDTNPIEDLRDPANSHGMCDAVTEQFVAFAKAHGFKAYVTNTDLEEMGYKPTGQGGEVGFDDNDEMQYGFYPEHTIATVIVDDPAYPYGREFYIDFTASQYGYTDHPKVTSKMVMAGSASSNS